jgi:branched-chain amino acid transport system permease protein
VTAFINIGLSGLLMGLVYGLMALGLSVIFGVVRIVNFAHGEMMLLAVYFAVTLHQVFGYDPLLMSPFIALALFALGYLLQQHLVNRVLDRPEHVQFIILAAVALILINLQLVIFGPNAQSIIRPYSLDSFAWGAILVDKVKVYTACVALIATAALFSFFKYTMTGKAIRACADNRKGAMIVGLNVSRLYALSFAIGAACIGIAGCLMSLLINVTPHLAPELTLLSFIIVIIGGLGNLQGAILGGVLIGIIQTYAGFYVQASLKSLFSFGLLILVLLLRPQGLLPGRASS